MEMLELVHKGVVFSVPVGPLIAKCSTLAQKPARLRDGYEVRSNVSADVFGQFVDFIKGGDLRVTPHNSAALEQLAGEFGVPDLFPLLRRPK
jgi:hypothetical protein